MTYLELYSKLEQILCNQEIIDKQCEAFMDFPKIPGSINSYEITNVTKNGIMIKNLEANRPLGHE